MESSRVKSSHGVELSEVESSRQLILVDSSQVESSRQLTVISSRF